MANSKKASSGHKLGQIIGDWYEQYFALPLLEKVASELGLYLDNRYKSRSCRGDKIIWRDADDVEVDYDFVMELNGNDNAIGTPVAFFETFWRRGSRHSKDKARDDTGKLLPMKQTYSTSRVLGIISAGDFTGPARELVLTRGVDLFYIPKNYIVRAWLDHGIKIDYPDNTPEEKKAELVEEALSEIRSDVNKLKEIANTLVNLIGESTIESYKNRLSGKIGATPQQYSIRIESHSKPLFFKDYVQVDEFLNNSEPEIIDYELEQLYKYMVDFNDGDYFERGGLKWEEVREVHNSLKQLIVHLEKPRS